MDHLKLFDSFNPNGDLDRDFDTLEDIVQDIEFDYEFDYKVSPSDMHIDSYIMKMRGKEKYFVEILLTHKVGSDLSEFANIIYNSKSIVNLIYNGIRLRGRADDKNREKIQSLKKELINSLKNTSFIQKIEQLTNYDLVDAGYVEIGRDGENGNWVNDEEKWGARIYLKYKF
jgi:hypothetical protein